MWVNHDVWLVDWGNDQERKINHDNLDRRGINLRGVEEYVKPLIICLRFLLSEQERR